MGRRLNVSTPTVINTELVPLDEYFYLDVDGQMEQWYYDNTQQYAPNRKITPLTLTPTLSAYDKDTQMSYKPSFYYVSWYENAYRTDYIEKHYYALSNYDTADSGLYPSDITSWNESLTALVPYSYPQQPQSKPYIWVKKYKRVGGVTTETYSLFEDGGHPIYIRGYAFPERPRSPEEGDIALNIGNNDYGYEVYEGGQWVQEDAFVGDAFFDAGDQTDNTLYVKYDQSPFWKTKEYNINENGGYVETEITNTVDSNSADYVVQGNNLLVKKNVSYSHAVSIRCAATYIDPRDSGVTYAVEDSVNLTTNRNSDVVFLNVAITSPSSRAFNPLVDYKDKVVDGETLAGSIFKFYGTITNEDSIGAFTFIWYGIKDGNEVLANTLPWYVSGQNTDTLVVDAMYGESINVLLRAKFNDKQDSSPSKAYASLIWRTPDIEAFVQSDNGGAVRSDTEDMTFDTIINVNGDVLSDAIKQEHLAFNWKIRKNNVSTETDKGWGQRITIDASDLRNVKGSGSTLASTLVGNEVYLLGAYEEVTDDNEVVTDDGQTVFDRPVN